MTTLLASLCTAGVLERHPSRTGAFLRVTPRFLAHAEATASRLGLSGQAPGPQAALGNALASWDDYHADPIQGALLLHDLLEARGQLGLLRPVFPMLEQFAAVAA